MGSPDVVAAQALRLRRRMSWSQLALLLAGQDPEQLAARLRPQATRAYDQLAAGLGDYGASAPTSPGNDRGSQSGPN